jgi:hypothetical protein
MQRDQNGNREPQKLKKSQRQIFDKYQLVSDETLWSEIRPLTGKGELILTDPPFVTSDDKLKPKGSRKPKPISQKQRERNEEENEKTGREGELYILELEKRSLEENGKPGLVKGVIHTSKEIGDGMGYDIESRTLEGEVKYIEVKTTKGDNETPFFISATEINFSKQKPDNYYLYRLHDFDKNSPNKFHYVIRGNMEKKLVLLPDSFKGLPKKE